MKTKYRNPFPGSILSGLLGALILSLPLMAQDKISPRLDIVYYQIDSGSRHLQVKVRKRVAKRFQPIAKVYVQVSMELPDSTVEIGRVVTDDKGEGKVVLDRGLVTAMDKLDEYVFMAGMSESDSLEEVTESLTVKPSRLRIETVDADKSITIGLETKTDGIWQPQEGTELAVFIKRRFGRLVMGEESNVTDADGLVKLAYGTEITGDENGVLTFEAAIEDNDELGNVYATVSAPWGIPLSVTDGFYRRTLWATRDKTPWWLLVFPNLIIAGVWGVIAYLLLMIAKMKKLSRTETDDSIASNK